MKLQSKIVKQTAQSYGFALCGIAKAEPLSIEKERFEKALTRNFHAKKTYLERDIDKRFHPEWLLTNCKTVVVCGFNYNMEKGEERKEKGEKEYLLPSVLADGSKNKISQYAQIIDYHVFMKEKLEALAQDLQKQYGNFHYKTTVDSSAISEKAWAVQAGIGYYGKNGVIQTQFGSFIFLGILLIDKEVDTYDAPNQSSCGDCGKCIAACPTKAIVAPYYVDSNQCISHILQYESDSSHIAKYGWLKGCDACQNVCPNNANAPINEEALKLRVALTQKAVLGYVLKFGI